jgi:peptidyl-prolyl cis-trans isomerase D
VATARARAEQALSRARSREAFVDVVRAMSDDNATKENGGSLGTHVHGQLDAALDDVFITLEPGEVAREVVRTDQGFHVLKLVSRDASEVQPFEAVRESLYQQLVEREMGRQQQLWLKELRRRAFLQMRLQPSGSSP